MQDWDSLRIVLAVARHGGLNGAARCLGVTHATVSRQLARAEEQAGLRLFDRLPTGLVPTAPGRTAIAHAEEVEARVHALDFALEAERGQGPGTLAITVPPLVANADFAADIAVFRARHPGIVLSLLGDNRVLNLHRREADVALRVSHSPAESLWGRVIARQRAGWFASRDYIEAHQAVLSGEDRQRPLPYGAFTAWTAPRPAALEARFPGAVPVIESDDMITALNLARAGQVMVRAPCLIGAGDAVLIRVPGLALIDYAPIWAVTHPDLRRVPRVAEFIRFIAARFAARAETYFGADG
jgi:DNA-binding transcriptional LysR family regulator